MTVSLNQKIISSKLHFMRIDLKRMSAILLTLFCVIFAMELVPNPQLVHQSSSQQTDCNDLCDAGTCHLGHCSDMNFATVSSNQIVPVLVTFYKINSLHVYSYYTDQPIRPPQLS